MTRPTRGYFAVKLTALEEPELRSAYLSMYEEIATTLGAIEGFALHAPHRLTDPHATSSDQLSPRDVYLLDRLHVAHAEVLVACIELPSFGVGAELQIASDNGAPVIAFYYAETGRDPSRFVLGLPGVGPAEGTMGSRLLRYAPNIAGREELSRRLLKSVREICTARPQPLTRRRRGIACSLEHRRRTASLSPADLAAKAAVLPETIELLALAGDPFERWLAQPNVRLRTSLERAEIDEDLVLLPSLDAVLRLVAALEIPARDVGTLLGFS